MQIPLGQLIPRSVAIANGGTTSAAIPTEGASLVGVQLPAALTSTTLTFLMSDSVAGTYVPVYNSAGQVSYTIAQGRFYAIDPKDFQGIAFLKLVFGSAEGAARTIICSLKGI